MTRKQHKLQGKPLNMLCLVPSEEQKQGPNPFEPSAIRLAMRKVAVAMEDWTERFETWCTRRSESPTPSLAQCVRRLIGTTDPSATALTIQDHSPVHLPRWELSVGELIFRLRDRASHVQRSLMAQARELKEWMAQHTLSTQTELNSLRAQVMAQDTQLQQLTAQLQDVRALVSSQQQVLVYMGRNLDTVPGSAPAHRPAPSAKTGSRSKKAAKSKRRAPAEAVPTPYLNA